MPAQPDLIFDLGVCNGDDSAYYLHKGYRVVGVEANPLLIPKLSRRFEAEIASGRYVLLPLGIADTEGETEFWVCDGHAEWSSFDRSIASRGGARHHAEMVRTSRFRSLLKRFGTPKYCKIDIEGNDNLCLKDMSSSTRPDYVSVEVICAGEQVRLLQALGYTRFKLISQRTLRQPGKALAKLKASASILPPFSCVMTAIEARLTRRRFDGNWRFPGGSSGPFGENTHGRWLNAGEATELSEILARRREAWDWFDLHAG
ncbi:MAG TPA: FkbM family methyltransferase [Sphingomicrobium sp.]|nr:FkbM family methyltransferase [Sphingomicrobium sp.]